MNRNRTSVEEGDYSIPSNKKRPLLSTRAKGIIWLAAFLVLSELALNIYWTNYLGGKSLLINRPLWGWTTYIGLLQKYGLKSFLLVKVAFALSASFLLAAVVFRVFFFDRSDADKDMTAILHGSSHWAKADEIQRAGLMSQQLSPLKKLIRGQNSPANAGSQKASVIIGGWRDPKHGKTHYLKHSGPEHVIAIAPTRSGKGVGLVVPTLLNWTDSVLVLDIKGENWLLSAGWREKNVGPCLRFEPTDPGENCAHYNPLAEVSVGTTNETREIQQIAGLIIDPDGKGLEDYWAKAGYSLLTGAITHELYRAAHENREPSIARVRLDITTDNKNALLEDWRNYLHTAKGTHPVVYSVACEMLGKADKELSGVFSTANSCLNLWVDKIIAKNTTDSTFHIQDLVNQDKPVSIYIVIPPSDLVRLRPILRLFVTQVVFTLTQKMEVQDGNVTSGHKHKLLLMLDEFPQLRRLDLLEAALAFMGGYGLKAYMICQSYTQLTDIYGKDETISSNCHIQICYAPNDEATAKVVSEKCGRTTVTVRSSNISGKRFAIGPFGKTSENISYTQQARELMLPDETRRLPTAKKDADGRVIEPGELLVFASGTAPIYGIQTPFFLDQILHRRSKISPPETCNFTPLPLQRENPVTAGCTDEEIKAFLDQQAIASQASSEDANAYVPENVELPPVEGDLSDEATPFEDEVNDDEIYREPVENSDIGDLGIENTLGLDPQPEPSNEEDQDAPDPTDTDNGDGMDKMSLLEAISNNIYSAPSANGFGYGDDEDKN
mgnify:FL=1